MRTTTRGVGRAITMVLGLGVGLGVGGGVAGCATYANVPEPEGVGAVASPNARNPRAVMITGLRRVIALFPPGSGRFGVALPEGSSAETADEVLAAMGPDAAPVFGPSELPTYTVGRIWIRAGKAKVDIYRPVVELGRRADGSYERQAVTVWLEGGLGPWRVERTQVWEVGAFPTPEIADPFAWPGGGGVSVPVEGEEIPEPEPAAEPQEEEEPEAEPAPLAEPVQTPGGLRIETLPPERGAGGGR